jgi:hypothetical protein
MLIRRRSEFWVFVRPGTDGRGRWQAAFQLAANGMPGPDDVAALGRDEPESFNA